MPLPATPNLVLVGAIVFAANAGLLVLQLLAGKLLAPFVGSSLETWSAVIGVFLVGIAAGNAYGGKLADENPSPRRLSAVLLMGCAAAAWMVLFPMLLHATDGYKSIRLGPRIPVLTAILCFPAGFALSLLTPLAIRTGLPDVTKAGRAAGRVFALGTLGCLAGNYFTGFYLLAVLPIDVLALGVAGVLLATSGVTYLAFRNSSPRPSPTRRGGKEVSPLSLLGKGAGGLGLRRGYVVVFLCSFAAMTLELTATRLLAQVFGTSLFTWTGAIGVMLAGTAAGNWLGGRTSGSESLARGLIAAAGAMVVVVILFILAVQTDFLPACDVQLRIVGWSFMLFFLPMVLLGTVSPRVVRLVVPSVESAGRVAGRVYAWSTVGAIAGTFATGFLLIAELGMLRVVLVAALLPAAATFLAAPVWKRTPLLYPLCVVSGAAVAGLFAFTPEVTRVTKETNYYAIHVKPARNDAGDVVPNRFTLQLDSLVHSRVDLTDPTFLHYKHENVQMEILKWIHTRVPAPRVLVIGGGGYTFPRCAKTLVPSCSMDVVEIDPGVTAVGYEKLGLDPALGIHSYHMDGRQFVAEKAPAGAYDLITLDAVNDLSVPAHLLTYEFNQAVQRILAPNGAYLLSVIDTPAYGELWRMAAETLKRSFGDVRVLLPREQVDFNKQSVMVLYATKSVNEPNRGNGTTEAWDNATRSGEIREIGYFNPSTKWYQSWLNDRYAPVDQLMIDVFRRRKLER